MIPQYLILNSEQDSREVGLLTQYFPVEDGEVFTNILECIGFNEYADLKLEAHAWDIQTMLIDAGCGEFAEPMARLVLKLGRNILTQLRQLNAYHNGYLIYCYHQDLNGDLVLRALEYDDLDRETLRH